MDFLTRMNRVIDYVEAHLCEELDYAEAARQACCTVYQLQRTFAFVADLPLSEYVRRRRLTLAALELQQNSPERVLDLALKYGYESPTAFNRAFQSLHGIPPSAARAHGAKLKSYPRISFQFTVKGVTEMNYRIEEKPAFQVYGIEGIFDTENGENLKAIPAFWWEKLHNGETTRLMQSAGNMSTLNAICDYRKEAGTRFPYLLCAVRTPLCDVSGYTVVDVPASTWAIFRSETHGEAEVSGSVQELSRRVYTEWFANAAYEEIAGYEMEIYVNTMEGDRHVFFEEVWIRVQPK